MVLEFMRTSCVHFIIFVPVIILLMPIFMMLWSFRVSALFSFQNRDESQARAPGITIRQTGPQTPPNHHKSPQTTTNFHQNLGRLVVKTVESWQTTANHRKPLQTTARIWDDDYSSAGKTNSLSKVWILQSSQALSVEHVPNRAYLRRFGGGL